MSDYCEQCQEADHDTCSLEDRDCPCCRDTTERMDQEAY